MDLQKSCFFFITLLCFIWKLQWLLFSIKKAFYGYRCFTCLYVCIPMHMCVCCPQWPEEDFGSSGTRIANYCGPPMGAGNWKSNPGPLQEKHVLLTTEPILQPHDGLSYARGKDEHGALWNPGCCISVTLCGVTSFCVFRKKDNITGRLLEIWLHLTLDFLNLIFVIASYLWTPYLLWLASRFHSV